MPYLTPTLAPEPNVSASDSPHEFPKPPTDHLVAVPKGNRCLNFDDLGRDEEDSQKSRIPTVYLSTNTVTSSMAAKLATSLLGHVLFLKSQVPFPVMQLSRMPGGQANTRAGKLKTEFLSSFDTLSSHLLTTFTALSTAYALRGCTSNFPKPDDPLKGDGPCQAYLSILVGPSIGSARAKVVYAVDGLEAKQWGLREQVNLGEEDDDETEEDGGDDADSDCVDEDGDEGEPGLSDVESSEGSDDESDNNESEEENRPTPQSRSPSPVPVVDKPPSPLSVKSMPLSSKRPHMAPPPPISFSEEQQALRTAERNLARTLANASANEDEDVMDMSCELAPTQTHILLRAPRRFSHPAWIPRQNMTVSLDGILDEFMIDSNLPPLSGPAQPQRKTTTVSGRKPGKSKGKNKVEGVWIKCQHKGQSTASAVDVSVNSKKSAMVIGDREIDELDEMIWWSWDGKIVGFSDW